MMRVFNRTGVLRLALPPQLARQQKDDGLPYDGCVCEALKDGLSTAGQCAVGDGVLIDDTSPGTQRTGLRGIGARGRGRVLAAGGR